MRIRGEWAGWLFLSVVSLAPLLAEGDARLARAARMQNDKELRVLLRQGVDVNAPEPDGATALHWAAHWDDLNAAQSLIEAGAKVNARNELGMTPLLVACANGSAQMIEKLLAARADANIPAPDGETALMMAARTTTPDAIEALVAHGANVKARENSRRQTALMWAVAERRPDIARVLIAHGADVNARSLVTQELIYRENPDPGDENAAKGQPHPAGEMMERGGSTPLLFAARAGDIECAKLLLAAGANVNDTAADGTSGLVMAAFSDQSDFAAFLLDHGADPNAAGAGYTALHIVALTHNRELLKALVAHSADLNARLTKGTPVRRFEDDLVLPQSLAGATPFLVAAHFAEADIMRDLASAGADTRLATTNGTTPLMAAIAPDRRSLALRGVRTRKAASPALEAVQLALQLGGDVNATNGKGDTALHVAAVKGSNAIVQLLADKGARLDVRNKLGQTPLGATQSATLSDSTRLRLKSTAELLRKLGGAQ
jgi:ankyrin repeat protein